MNKKSILNKIKGIRESNAVVSENVESAPQAIQANQAGDVTAEVDHLWMKEDLDAEKPKLVKDPRVDTGILRNRIADKIAKMNNH